MNNILNITAPKKEEEAATKTTPTTAAAAVNSEQPIDKDLTDEARAIMAQNNTKADDAIYTQTGLNGMLLGAELPQVRPFD